MRAAIPTLERRLVEVQALDPEVAAKGRLDGVKEVQLKIDDTLIDVFGNDTVEYERFRVYSLYDGPMYIGRGTPPHERLQGYERGKQGAVIKLQTIISLFKEKLGGLAETAGSRAIREAGARDFHPEIQRAAGELFKNGH
jgi:hypothetical protein